MELTEQALKEFEQLWLEEHPGQTLTEQELLDKAARVMRAFEVVYKEIPKEKEEIFNKFKN